jgi:hypothetical protein
MIFEASGPLFGAPLGLGMDRLPSPLGLFGLRLRSISWLIEGPCLPRNSKGVLGLVVMNCSQLEHVIGRKAEILTLLAALNKAIKELCTTSS